MNKHILIEYACEQDIPVLSKLLHELFTVEEDFEIDEEKQRVGLKMMLEDPGNRCVMVAKHEQRIVGMCTAQLLISTAEGGKSARIEDMVIHREYRGAGIGSRLLSAVEQWAIGHGAKRLELLADRNNESALEFYDRNQWKHTQLICLHKK